MATTRQAHARFQRGAGVYSCRCCKRATRGSGGDSAGVQLCDQCYTLAGIENAWQDSDFSISDARETLQLLAVLSTKKDAVLKCWDTLKAEAEAMFVD